MVVKANRKRPIRDPKPTSDSSATRSNDTTKADDAQPNELTDTSDHTSTPPITTPDAVQPLLLDGDFDKIDDLNSSVDYQPSTSEQAQTDTPRIAPSFDSNREGPVSTEVPRGPKGEFTTLGDVETYIATPVDYPHISARMIILLTGGAGIHAPESQALADRFACAGFLVIMPDQYGNDPIPQLDSGDGDLLSFNLNIVGKFQGLLRTWSLDRWIAYQTPARIVPILIDTVSHAIGLYPGAVYQSSVPVSIPVVGVLLGAKNAACLASELERQLQLHHNNPTDLSPPFLVKTLALANPALLMSSNLEYLNHGSAVQIINRHGDPILTDCPASQANPYVSQKEVDIEVGNMSSETEANESLPPITELRAKGVKVDIIMYDGSLPAGFIMGHHLQNSTPGAQLDAQESLTERANEKAAGEIIAFLRKNT